MSESALLMPLLRRWSRYTQFSQGDEHALFGLPAIKKSLPRDAYLVREGEPPIACNVVLSGLTFRQKILPDGERQIISFHIQGEFVDLQNTLLEVADHNVQCLTNCEVAIVPKAPLIAIMDAHPQIARAMWLDSLLDASIFREWVVNVGRRDARSRIAHLLCELILRMANAGLGTKDNCIFPLTQEQLADATGLTPVHTNRTLQALRKDGLIRLSTRQLTVLDWDGLCAVGDFNERYLHHDAQPGLARQN